VPAQVLIHVMFLRLETPQYGLIEDSVTYAFLLRSYVESLKTDSTSEISYVACPGLKELIHIAGTKKKRRTHETSLLGIPPVAR
jgi:hypothetical protein